MKKAAKDKDTKNMIKFKDPVHKIWVRYFVADFHSSTSSIKQGSSLEHYLSEFNLDPYPLAQVTSQFQSIEANPGDSLPLLFNFEQPISKSYFLFINELTEIQIPNKPKIISDVFPHLMRCSISFFYKMTKHFSQFLSGQFSDYFPPEFLEWYPAMLRILLQTPAPLIDDYAIILNDFVKTLSIFIPSVTSNQNSNVFMFLVKIFDQFFNYCFDVIELDRSWSSFISFSCLFFSNALSSPKVNVKIVALLEKFYQMVNLPKKIEIKLPLSAHILSTISASLFYISKQKDFKNNLPLIAEMCLKILNTDGISMKEELFVQQELYTPSTDISMMANAITFCSKALFCSYFTEDPVLKQVENLPLTEPFHHYYGPIISQELNQVIPDNDRSKTALVSEAQFMPTFLTNNPGILKFFVQLTTLFSKDPRIYFLIISHIISLFHGDSTFTFQIFAVSLLLLGPYEVSLPALIHKSIWMHIINMAAYVPYKMQNSDKWNTDLIAATKTLIFTAFTSKFGEPKLILSSFEELIQSKLVIAKDVYSNILSLFNASPQIFLNGIRETTLMETLMAIDEQCRLTMLKSGFNQELFGLRNQFLSLITKIQNLDKNPELSKQGLDYLFGKQERSNYLFSLSFEKNSHDIAINLFKNCLSSSSPYPCIQSLNVYIINGLIPENLTSSSWQQLILSYIQLITNNLPSDLIIQSIISSGLIETLSQLVVKADNFDFSMKILSLLRSFCHSSLYFIEELSNPAINFFQPWNTLFSKHLDKFNDNIDQLMHFAFLDDLSLSKPEKYKLIQNIEGAHLLLSIGLQLDEEKVSIPLCKYLSQICENSQINYNHLYRADAINLLFNKISLSLQEPYLKLLRAIGSSFFGPKELTNLLPLINKVSSNFALPLMQIFRDMINNSPSDCRHPDQKSFYHFDYGTSKFVIPKISLPRKFTISMKLRISYLSFLMKSQYITLFKITSSEVKERISQIQLLFRGPQLFFGATGQSFSVVTDKLPPNKFFQLYVSFSPREITFIKDKELISTISLNQKLTSVIDLSNVDFEISNFYADIDDITIYDSYFTPSSINDQIDTSIQIACYSARVMNHGKCPNIASGSDSFGSALFNGFCVQYSNRVNFAISNCGGVTLLLPLFKKVPEALDQVNYTITLLEIVLAIAKKFDPLFLDQYFFRSLDHVLNQLPDDTITSDFLDVLSLIYEQLTFIELRQEMVSSIWNDFSLWTKFHPNVRHFHVSTILPRVFKNDPDTFISIISFRSFFYSITTFFTDPNVHHPDPDPNSLKIFIKECWAFLGVIVSKQFSVEDARALLTSVSNFETMLSTMESIELSYQLISRENPTMILLLSKNDCYIPFYPLLSYTDEEVQICAINLLALVTFKIKSAPDFSTSSLSGLKSFQPINHSNEIDKNFNVLHLLEDYMYGRITPGGGVHTKSAFTQNTEQFDTIKNAKWLPFICHVLRAYPKEEQKRFCSYLKESLKLKPSMLEISHCSHWQIWIEFLSLYDNSDQEWIALIADIAIASLTPNEIQKTTLLLYAIPHIFNVSFENTLRTYIVKLVENIKNISAFIETLRYLYFIPADSIFTQHQESNDPSCKNMFFLSKQIIDLQPASESFSFMIRLSEKKWDDFQIAISVLNRFTISDFCLLKQSLPISTEEKAIPGVLIAAITLHFLSCTNQDSSSIDYLSSILTYCSSTREDKNAIRQSLFLLLNDFKNDNVKVVKIVQSLKEIDPLLETLSTESVVKIASLEMQPALATLSEQASFFKDDFNKNLSAIFTELKQDFGAIFSDNVIGCSEEKYFIKERNQYQDFHHRLLRQSEVIYNHVIEKMSSNGGPWSRPSEENHWKMDPLLDSIGRRLWMRQNHHFKDHHEAVLARSTSIAEVATKEERYFMPKIEIGQQASEEDSKIFFEMECQMVTVTSYYKGTVYFTKNGITFEASGTTDPFGTQKDHTAKIVEILANEIVLVLNRRHLHMDIGLEIFTESRRSYFLIFSNNERSKFVWKLQRMKLPNLKYIQKSSPARAFAESGIQKRWVAGQMSNYEYLYWVNMYAGRSFNDLSQYPIFPWIIQDYESDNIDLSNPSVYRDLSKPIGAINEKRLNELKMLFEEIKDVPDSSLYRLHYSTSAYVIHYLIRCEPFTSLHIELQNGRFDFPGRLFISIPKMWSTISGTTHDFRELIPEFFSTPEFLINSEHFDLGKFELNGTEITVDNVELPKWAHSPQEFITIHRMALESPFVSEHISEWIDLIFGFKQQSMEYNNFFAPSSVSSSIINANSEDLLSIQHKAANFGITPEKLFTTRHPLRLSSHNLSARKSLRYILRINSNDSINEINNNQNPTPTPLQSSSDRTLQFSKAASLSKILILRCSSTSIYAFCFPGILYVSSLDKPDMTLTFKVSSRYNIRYPESLAKPDTLRRHSFLHPPSQLLLSSPWSESFELIDLSEQHGKAIYKPAGHAAAITALSASSGIVATAASDSSLFLWNTRKRRIVCPILAHSSPITTIDYCAAIDLLVSADSNKVCFASLSHRSFIRAFSTDLPPQRVIVSTLGFAVILMEERDITKSISVIELRDLSARLVSRARFEGSAAAIEIIKVREGQEDVVLAMKNGKIYVLTISTLEVMWEGKVEGNVGCIAFSKEKHALYISTDDQIFEANML